MGVPDPVHDSQFYDGVPLRRLFAFVLDLGVIFVLWMVVLFVGFLVTALTMGAGAPVAILLFSATGFVYRWIMLKERSATLGMILAGIEIRDARGQRLDGLLAFLHTAGFYVTLFFPPLLLIGWLLMATSPHRRVMHDLFLGTVAINRPA